MTIRVAVVGAGGRMGRTICDAVASDSELELVAAIDPRAAGAEINGLVVGARLEALSDASASVVVDFTVASAARETIGWLADHGMHAVVGTTGLDDDDVQKFRTAFRASNCLIASNFAISAVLMMRFAELAAPFFETAEIIELHHDGKVDAPSGTAVATANRMAAASQEWTADRTTHEVVEGVRGGVGPGGIHIHSVRLRGIKAHQEVVLGAVGQSLTIRQDAYDNSSYLPGILLACKRIADMPGVTIGLDAYLDL